MLATAANRTSHATTQVQGMVSGLCDAISHVETIVEKLRGSGAQMGAVRGSVGDIERSIATLGDAEATAVPQPPP